MDDVRTTAAALGDLVTIWAHPDDEAYLVAGLMAMATDAGRRVTCVTATRGERGGPPDLQGELFWRRPEELDQALAAVGVTDRVLLDHPDGGCADIDPQLAAAQLLAVLDDRRPDTVVTFGPDGMTGHPDHQAVSRWVDLAVARMTEPRPLVLHAAETPAQVEVLLASAAAEMPDLAPITMPDPARIAIDIDLPTEILDRKMAALRAHASQTAGLEAFMGSDTYRRWVASEGFALAEVNAPAHV